MAKNIKATVATKVTNKKGGGNGVAKMSKPATVKSSTSGKVNTPPKKAVPCKQCGGMIKK
jgi:hypothetical protein